MLYGLLAMIKDHVNGTLSVKDHVNSTPSVTTEEEEEEEDRGGEFPTGLGQEEGLRHVASASPAVCKHYLQGKCKFGDRCALMHPSAGRRGQTKSTPPQGTGRKEGDQTPKNDKPKKPKKFQDGCPEDVVKKVPMRQAADVISRILWDPDLPAKDFTVGYLDRFLGILEKPFADFSWEDLASVGHNTLAVPKHRIQYFKYKDTIVWDKRCQLDDFFGSRGGHVIGDIVDKSAENAKKVKQVEQVEQVKSEQVAPSHRAVDQGFLEEEEEEGPVLASVVDNKDRPNHFVCVHITSEEVKGMVEEIQDYICGHTPQLREGCLPIDALHVTLCMVRLNSEQDKAVAQSVLSNAQEQFLHFLPPCFQLSFRGVDNFRERLVYVKVEPEPALERFVSYLLDQFHQVGLGTPGNHDQYTPHMTILKLSRPMARKLHTHAISPASYLVHRDSAVGKHTVDSLYLCSMTEAKQGDGFYLRLASARNSLSCLPSFGPLLVDRLGRLAQQGVITVAERDLLVGRVGQGGAFFDLAVEDVRRLCLQESAKGACAIQDPPTVVVLRGVPGSGKSRLVGSCREVLSNPSSVAICSADHYFEEGGVYRFETRLLPKAHAHCLGRFVQALGQGKELVVVDNTNSMLWEYRVYHHICEVLGLRYHVLEVPCGHPSITSMFCSRNVHGIDMGTITRLVERWDSDRSAIYVPPFLVFPRLSPEPYSLLSLCSPDTTSTAHLLTSHTHLTPLYTAMFLSVEAQWALLAACPPTHPQIYADHITLQYSPSARDLRECGVGTQVTVRVTGKADNGRVQAVVVELPRGVPCGNRCPHITISTGERVPPKETNAMLQGQVVQQPCSGVQLGGVVGVMVRVESGDVGGAEDADQRGSEGSQETEVSPSVLVTSADDLERFVLPHLEPEAPVANNIASTHEICTGVPRTTQLFIFDFDGTLFDTPDPGPGRVMYERLAGKPWPHRGWLCWPESILPPMKVKPLPAIAEFRKHLNRAGSITVLMTGRSQRMARAVKVVLDSAHLVPQKYIFKPDDTFESTSAYKSRVIEELLDEFPDIAVVKIWDDDYNNIAAFHQVAKSCSRNIQFDIIDATQLVSVPEQKSSAKPATDSSTSVLENYLMSYGYISSLDHSSAAASGVWFLAQCHAALVGFHGDPTLLTYEFGSHLLGRGSDVDICLLVPPPLTIDAAMEGLAGHLSSCGVTHIHTGHSLRCPRLKVMLCFANSPCINYDIVFAVMGSEAIFATPPPVQPPASELQTSVKSGDSASKAALNGPIFLQHVDSIIQGALTRKQFGALVEAIVLLFSAHCLKGNAYHCPRTFHIVQLLADFVKSRKATLKHCSSLDHIFKEFVTHVALLSPEKWSKLFGEFVPQEFIPRVGSIFSTASQHVSKCGYPSVDILEDMMCRPQFPPEGYTTVTFALLGTDDVQLWKLHTTIESRLPTYIRQLLRGGMDVVPDGHTKDERRLSFAVPNSRQTKDTLQHLLRPLWNELADHRRNKSATVELQFGAAVQGVGPGAEDSLEEQVVQFSRSPASTELHLHPSLSSYERLKAHELAEQLGLEHCTVGNGKGRHIVLRKK